MKFEWMDAWGIPLIFKKLDEGEILLIDEDYGNHQYYIKSKITDTGEKKYVAYYPKLKKCCYLREFEVTLLHWGRPEKIVDGLWKYEPYDDDKNTIQFKFLEEDEITDEIKNMENNPFADKIYYDWYTWTDKPYVSKPEKD